MPEKLTEEKSSLSLEELFTEDFLKEYTRFTSVEDMFKEGGFEIKSGDDFDKISKKEWNKFIKNNTKFKKWQDMLEKAVELKVLNQLQILL